MALASVTPPLSNAAPGEAATTTSRWPALSLAFCAIGSIVLVAIVALLIAFMQYQSRLIRAQPGITAGQLVYYVDTDKKIDEMIASIKEKSTALLKLSQDATIENVEIEFRIGRVCRIFGANIEQVNSCHDFMRRIPFEPLPNDSSTANAAPADIGRSPARDSVSPPSSTLPRSTVNLHQIKQNFLNSMNETAVNGTKLSTIIDSYIVDIKEIAEKNQKYLLETAPLYNIKHVQYRLDCNYISDLMSTLTYRQSANNGCRDVSNQPNYNAPSLPRSCGRT